MKRFFLICLSVSSLLHAQSAHHVEEKKVIVCAACHGAEGKSVNPEWPNLAGQHARYLLKQMHDYQQKQGRVNAVMSSILVDLSSEEMAELADYYERLPQALSEAAQQPLQKGEQLYRMGDFEKRIASCITCHGPKGTGNSGAGFPSLVGQHPEYLILQMQQFKSGIRRNDLNGVMQDACKKMTLDDMVAVANYLATLK